MCNKKKKQERNCLVSSYFIIFCAQFHFHSVRNIEKNHENHSQHENFKSFIPHTQQWHSRSTHIWSALSLFDFPVKKTFLSVNRKEETFRKSHLYAICMVKIASIRLLHNNRHESLFLLLIWSNHKTIRERLNGWQMVWEKESTGDIERSNHLCCFCCWNHAGKKLLFSHSLDRLIDLLNDTFWKSFFSFSFHEIQYIKMVFIFVVFVLRHLNAFLLRKIGSKKNLEHILYYRIKLSIL